MDIALYTSLLSRHRRLVTVGIVASVALAVFSFVRISPSGIGYRTNETWINQSTLLVTQTGFHEGRSRGGNAPDTGLERFSTLVDLYAALVESDEVVNLLVKRGLVDRKDVVNGELPVVATPVVSPNGASTPLMTISGSATSAKKATALTVGATRAFIDTLERRQATAGIPPSQRTLVQVVRRSSEPQLTAPRSKSLPIVVLLAGLSATIAAAFVRDNSRRRQPVELGAAQSAEDPTPILATLDSETPTRDKRRGPPGKAPLGARPAESQRRASQS